MEAGLQKISNNVSSTRRAGRLAMAYQIVCPSRRACTRPSRRSSDRCCETVEFSQAKEDGEVAHRPLTFGQLAEDQQPVPVTERLEQFACPVGCGCHLVGIDFHRRTFMVAYLR